VYLVRTRQSIRTPHKHSVDTTDYQWWSENRPTRHSTRRRRRTLGFCWPRFGESGVRLCARFGGEVLVFASASGRALSLCHCRCSTDVREKLDCQEPLVSQLRGYLQPRSLAYDNEPEPVVNYGYQSRTTIQQFSALCHAPSNVCELQASATSPSSRG
jgi:hypothetical protein